MEIGPIHLCRLFLFKHVFYPLRVSACDPTRIGVSRHVTWQWACETLKFPASQPFVLASLAWALSSPVPFLLFVASFLATLSPQHHAALDPLASAFIFADSRVHACLDESSEQTAPSHRLSWDSATPPLSLISLFDIAHISTSFYRQIFFWVSMRCRKPELMACHRPLRMNGARGRGGSTVCSAVVV